ncbi:predicted protein [Phaeodactylum tricornutum CCAP 1055/1]|uniref:Uncharacterized protein n=1 Tax=Phaeodactylum tricornutum (strain CCAP 1055/1) TaxID=556484 RepID=B7G528_PHATC|nr:predicted protein [Phaeodactylum tricornutum CCAP 1055/1]EEC46245.1 predicted protein [Phaeodactylum tricornutum CCAP 1055/1]|eukprot:XP_002182344.1 predicted protein [Phaeodactylum tricornutum CCAP 1055/1]
MQSIFIFVLCLTALVLHSSHAWTISPHLLTNRRISTPTARAMVQSVSLETLSDNHEEIASELSGSVQRWLDAEWMEQEVHVRMAESCKRSYLDCRERGEADLMAVMVQVADDLTENWRQYDKDAFVNAWDVSNYVSDYLSAKTGIEGCECSSTIH